MDWNGTEIVMDAGSGSGNLTKTFMQLTLTLIWFSRQSPICQITRDNVDVQLQLIQSCKNKRELFSKMDRLKMLSIDRSCITLYHNAI
jgi:hypothetical protein